MNIQVPVSYGNWSMELLIVLLFFLRFTFVFVDLPHFPPLHYLFLSLYLTSSTLHHLLLHMCRCDLHYNDIFFSSINDVDLYMYLYIFNESYNAELGSAASETLKCQCLMLIRVLISLGRLD